MAYESADTPDLSDERHKLICISKWYGDVGVFTGVRLLAPILLNYASSEDTLLLQTYAIRWRP